MVFSLQCGHGFFKLCVIVGCLLELEICAWKCFSTWIWMKHLHWVIKSFIVAEMEHRKGDVGGEGAKKWKEILSDISFLTKLSWISLLWETKGISNWMRVNFGYLLSFSLKDTISGSIFILNYTVIFIVKDICFQDVPRDEEVYLVMQLLSMHG